MRSDGNSIQIKRHELPMSPEQANETVTTVADLIVSFIQTNGVPVNPRARKENTNE